MRKVKDAKDLGSNELIYFKGHAKATYMSDGTTVEDAINNIDIEGGTDLSDYATKEELNSKQDTIIDLEIIRQGAAKGATSVQQGTLSTVATSGSYNDLTNKPTIPNAVSESTVSGWGFTKNAGTVTGVKVNGTTKNPSNGVVDLGTVITSHQDISGKQDKLVSGSNIKTINGESILGSGDITISGGEVGSVNWNDIQYAPSYSSANDLLDVNLVKCAQLLNSTGERLEFSASKSSLLSILTNDGDMAFRLFSNGDGTKFLSDDGTYKEVYTKSEIDTKLGDINTILESIING